MSEGQEREVKKEEVGVKEEEKVIYVRDKDADENTTLFGIFMFVVLVLWWVYC